MVIVSKEAELIGLIAYHNVHYFNKDDNSGAVLMVELFGSGADDGVWYKSGVNGGVGFRAVLMMELVLERC